MAPAKGDTGLRESERHVRQGPGVCGPGCAGSAPPPIPPHPLPSPPVPCPCPCVALEGKAIVLRHWLMLSEVVIIVCRHRQASGRLTPPPPFQPLLPLIRGVLLRRSPWEEHPRCSEGSAVVQARGGEVARWRGGEVAVVSSRGGGGRRDCGGTAEGLRRRPDHAQAFLLLTCQVGCARGEGDGGDGRRERVW